MINLEIKKLDCDKIKLAKDLILLFGFDDANHTLPSDEYVAEMLVRTDFYVIVGLVNDELIGGLTAYEMKMFKRETSEMFLYEVEVKESYRQKGVGKALIQYLKQICAEKGIVDMFVGTWKDNAAARKLYEATGGKADEDSVWFNYLFD